jgi:8-oxo-dGTP diphosphatase
MLQTSEFSPGGGKVQRPHRQGKTSGISRWNEQAGITESRAGHAMNEPKQRRAARLIVLDGQGRLLLFRYAWKPGESFWATPGGSLEGDETFEQAALREAKEELGVTGASLTSLWERTADFMYRNQPIRQQEKFYLISPNLPLLLVGVDDAHAREGILESRWWTRAALSATEETIFPEDLVARLKRSVD